jgi:hypothetical protein
MYEYLKGKANFELQNGLFLFFILPKIVATGKPLPSARETGPADWTTWPLKFLFKSKIPSSFHVRGKIANN